MAVQELEVHAFHVEDLSNNGSYNTVFNNVDGYLWFPIQGTPGTELGLGHTDTTYTNFKRQDRQREELHSEAERCDRQAREFHKQRHRNC